MLSDTEAAYAAGIFDGEGSISLTRNRRPSPQVSVASTDQELLDWLRQRFGGSIVKKQPRQITHSLSFDWKLTDRRALGFLRIVLPYLVIGRKRMRVKILLEAYLACTPRNGLYRADVLERKKRLIEDFGSLP